MTAMWSAAMELNSFNRNHAYISHYTSGAWDTQTASAAGISGSVYTMSRTGITSFSPFMVADSAANMTTGVSSILAAETTILLYPNSVTNTLHISANSRNLKVQAYMI